MAAGVAAGFSGPMVHERLFGAAPAPGGFLSDPAVLQLLLSIGGAIWALVWFLRIERMLRSR